MREANVSSVLLVCKRFPVGVSAAWVRAVPPIINWLSLLMSYLECNHKTEMSATQIVVIARSSSVEIVSSARATWQNLTAEGDLGSFVEFRRNAAGTIDRLIFHEPTST